MARISAYGGDSGVADGVVVLGGQGPLREEQRWRRKRSAAAPSPLDVRRLSAGGAARVSGGALLALSPSSSSVVCCSDTDFVSLLFSVFTYTVDNS
ncbi:hypothetical protein B566_EDAN010354 [Ephemera danica]|nr:hypothetical protein B566_EDAN010354 [Ephemera danica]